MLVNVKRCPLAGEFGLGDVGAGGQPGEGGQSLTEHWSDERRRHPKGHDTKAVLGLLGGKARSPIEGIAVWPSTADPAINASRAAGGGFREEVIARWSDCNAWSGACMFGGSTRGKDTRWSGGKCSRVWNRDDARRWHNAANTTWREIPAGCSSSGNVSNCGVLGAGKRQQDPFATLCRAPASPGSAERIDSAGLIGTASTAR